MYILGFLFLFLGISLLLYSLLVLFFSKNQQPYENNKHTVEPSHKEDTSSQIKVSTQLKTEDQPLSSSQNESQSFESESTIAEKKFLITNNDQSKSTKEMPSTTSKLQDIKSQIKQKITKKDFQDIPQEKSTQLINKDLELFITGYLYCDPAHTSYIILEKKDKTPGDNLSNLTRLGNASLEWNQNSFILNYDEKQINLIYYNLKEIRFMEDCAVFISKNPEDPYYFFLSKQINDLKSFLHQLSNN